MVEVQNALLARILASKPFAAAESLKKVLLYLTEQSTDSATGSPGEYEIAIDALGRPPDFDPKVDPIVRVTVARVWKRLHQYFQEEGRNEPIRLMIPKGEYRAIFQEIAASNSGLQEGHESTPCLEKFWQPYLLGNFKNTVVFEELLFFRDDEGNFLRNMYVNDPYVEKAELQNYIPGISFDKYRPSYLFVSTGEMHCMLALAEMFADMGVKFKAKNTRFCSWSQLNESNLILLGSSRSSHFISALQGGNNFVITERKIVNLNPKPGEKHCYQAERHMEGDLEKVTEYAVVTRRPGLTPNSAATIIATNHGRAIEAVGNFFTSEQKVRSLFETMSLSVHRGLPAHFQAVLKCELIDFDEAVLEVDCIAYRIIEEPHTASLGMR